MKEGREPIEGIEYQEIYSRYKVEIEKYKEEIAQYDLLIKHEEERMAVAKVDLKKHADDKNLYDYILDNYETLMFLREENIMLRKRAIDEIDRLEKMDKITTKMALNVKKDVTN
ncbi:MAG: hypothetical protein WC663_05225 [Patescibacteria group bacterium]|jgi:hypothetical protein